MTGVISTLDIVGGAEIKYMRYLEMIVMCVRITVFMKSGVLVDLLSTNCDTVALETPRRIF